MKYEESHIKIINLILQKYSGRKSISVLLETNDENFIVLRFF